MKLLQARLFEAQGKEQDSIDAYLEASTLAGDIDLAPTLVAVAILASYVPIRRMLAQDPLGALKAE